MMRCYACGNCHSYSITESEEEETFQFKGMEYKAIIYSSHGQQGSFYMTRTLVKFKMVEYLSHIVKLLLSGRIEFNIFALKFGPFLCSRA